MLYHMLLNNDVLETKVVDVHLYNIIATVSSTHSVPLSNFVKKINNQIRMNREKQNCMLLDRSS